jgi:ferrous iron transport protein A
MRLNDLAVGSTASVSGFSEEGAKFLTRYLSIGLIPGSAIAVHCIAPMGCPIQVKVGSTFLSIRRAEAEGVFVEETA